MKRLDHLAVTMASLRDLMLEMCDDMDSTDDVLEKEVILQTLLECEAKMMAAEEEYNAIWKQTTDDNG